MAATSRRLVFVAALLALGLLRASTVDSPRSRFHQPDASNVNVNAIAHDSVRDALTLDARDPDEGDDLYQERLVATLEVGVGLLAIPTCSRRLLPPLQPRTDGVPGCTPLSPRAPPLALLNA